jgi:mutator protein MutT
MAAPDRSAGIVLLNSEILLMERKRNEEHFWVFPGGKVEDGETPEQTAVREIQEETSLIVKTEKKLYTHIYNEEHENRGNQHFFLCTYISGTPQLGESNEKDDMETGKQYYKPQWVHINILPTLLLYPLEIRDWLIEDLTNNFKNTPKVAHINTHNLRQSL